MNKEFIPYDQALELKELGFDERCFGFYNPRHEISKEPLYEHTGGTFDNYNRTDYLVSAPLYQQAFRWFREKFESTIHIYQYQDTQRWDFDVYDNTPEEEDFGNPSYDTYEEAELACLKKLIEIVKNK